MDPHNTPSPSVHGRRQKSVLEMSQEIDSPMFSPKGENVSHQNTTKQDVPECVDGYLEKKSEISGRWSNRYFQLQGSSLTYYETKEVKCEQLLTHDSLKLQYEPFI